ncbi:MAG: FHA domain-containing protein [Anaerolineae bacterium]|nr:FHA domain-containing protein [Anaerolineae bacterium]
MSEQASALAKVTWRDPNTGATQEFVLMEGATASIGRSPSNDICIPERHVSRRHAVISYRDGIFIISDLGSANGTYVNNQKLTDPFPLASGDAIRLFVPELEFSAVVTAEEQETATRKGTLIVPVAAGGRPTLVVTSGPQEGAEYPLIGDSLEIGRATAGATWAISLQDRAVSRPHARLDFDGDVWRITDLNSANGTLVEGVPVTGEDARALADGDVLTLGQTMLLFRIGGKSDSG